MTRIAIHLLFLTLWWCCSPEDGRRAGSVPRANEFAVWIHAVVGECASCRTQARFIADRIQLATGRRAQIVAIVDVARRIELEAFRAANPMVDSALMLQGHHARRFQGANIIVVGPDDEVLARFTYGKPTRGEVHRLELALARYPRIHVTSTASP